jgi:branched-subunit amino acid transport protein
MPAPKTTILKRYLPLLTTKKEIFSIFLTRLLPVVAPAAVVAVAISFALHVLLKKPTH